MLDKSYKEQSVIKGDDKSLSIAAASIIAKVHRDRLMKKLSLQVGGIHLMERIFLQKKISILEAIKIY